MTTVIHLKQESSVTHIVVSINEILAADYGLYVWPCAYLLSKFIVHFKSVIQSKIVLEVGSGTGLCGLVSFHCGAASVILTDSEHEKQTLDNLRKVICMQDCSSHHQSEKPIGLDVMELTWGDFSGAAFDLDQLDIILAADCLYESKAFEPFIETVAMLLEKHQSCQVWMTYQIRDSERSLDYLLSKWRLKCFRIPLALFTPHVLITKASGGAASTVELTNDVIMLVIIRSNNQLNLRNLYG